MRDGRLVIPVAPALKRKIRGIVHDESASGKTVFIEPAEVVEANNRIRELEGDERREIIRILTGFSNQLRPSIPDVLLSYEFLAEIDFIRAKALFAEQISGLKPALENKQLLDWTMAVHPLLQLSLAKHGKKVVPLDIELNEKQRPHHLRSERRRQVRLLKDSRLITIHAAIRTTHPDARTQSCRNIQQYIHRHR